MHTRALSFYFLLITSCFLTLATPNVYAQADNLDIGNIQLKSKNLPASPPTITPEPKQITNPIITKHIILDKYSTGLINIDLSLPLLSFTSLEPTNPQLRKNSLSINITGDSSLGLYIYTNGPLTNQSNQQNIPATNCDNGNCSPNNTDEWSSTLTYGLGYNCIGGLSICPVAFTDSNSYRPLSISLTRAIPLDTGLMNTSQVYSLLYKLNVSAEQASGTYISNVEYLFLPNL